MNKAKIALHQYQAMNFKPQSHFVVDFDLNAYPETACGTALVGIARAIGLRPRDESDAELRARLLQEFDKVPPPKKNKKL